MDAQKAQKAIGRNVRRLRKRRGWTVAQLAEAVGVSDGCVDGWEAGRWSPNAARLGDVARVLGCTPNDLYGVRPE